MANLTGSQLPRHYVGEALARGWALYRAALDRQRLARPIPSRTKRYPPLVHWDGGTAAGKALCGSKSKWGIACTRDPKLVGCTQCWWHPLFPRPQGER